MTPSWLLVAVLLAFVQASPPMCHCPNGQVGMQCPSPITFNCPPQAPCPSSPPCNMFAGLPTLPTFSPQSFQTLAPFTLAPLPGAPQGITGPPQLPPAVAPPTNGQETLVGINQPAPPPPVQYNNQGPQYNEAPPPPPPLPPQQQQQQQHAPQVQIPVQDATTLRPSTLPSETYVELENPETNVNEPPPPVLQNTVDKVFESEPNNGYRQPVRRQAPPLSEKCNDDRLRRIIEENVDDNPSTSKRKIQKAAADEIGGLFDVICSAHDFSYLANTQLFCESGNDDVTCFAFLHSLIQ
ncbi:unnamed protein product [Caenorhabditis sp. 36 PRJEB53466]|nr:unnamed protein product [Caenorhabditis sp. 36 PRJEB53466]